MKTIITFGSEHLEWLHHKINPIKVALVVEADSEEKAREKVFNSRIGEYFATSYPYEKYIDEFKKEFGMKEYTLEELECKEDGVMEAKYYQSGVFDADTIRWENVGTIGSQKIVRAKEYTKYYNGREYDAIKKGDYFIIDGDTAYPFCISEFDKITHDEILGVIESFR